jgi:apolipoprotein D and lipocalin family protein
LLVVWVAGCTGIPDGLTAVGGFDVERYLGTWYEIARLDHSFERGLSNVTASYAWRDDGGIRVINKGYDREAGKWKQVEGKAFFVGDPDLGRLKVSFFGPFYGGYNVIDLDKQSYSYALVCGPDRSYLWILARSPVLDEKVLQNLVAAAAAAGFATDQLIYVDHAPGPAP